MPGRRAAAAADHRGDLARPHRRALGAPDRLAGRRRPARPTTRWSRRWTRSARSARPARRCARPRSLRDRLPLPTLTVVVADADGAAGVRRRSSPTSSTSRRSRLLDVATATEARRSASRSGSRSTPAPPARGWARTCSAIKGSKSGDWSVADDGTVTAGGLALVEGEYTLETVVDADAGRGRTRPAMLPGGGFVVLDTDGDPRAGGRGRWPATWSARSSRPAATPGCDVSDRIALTVTGRPGRSSRRPSPTSANRRRRPWRPSSARRRTSTPCRPATAAVDVAVGDGQPVRILVKKL